MLSQRQPTNAQPQTTALRSGCVGALGPLSPHAVVVGAGVGGLCAALVLAHAGWRVTLLDRAAQLGGKLRCLPAGSLGVDAGPTVFTLRSVFEALFAQVGESLDQHLALAPLQVLARHVWADGARLDLLADHAATLDAIGRFAGAGQARSYQAFVQRSRKVFETLDRGFMQAQRPSPWSLVRQAGWRGLPDLMRIAAFTGLWTALERQFDDPRLRQLFGRYATYCGSSPFQSPATLMLVAHAERLGVWQVEGGMQRIAQVLGGLAVARGARLRLGCAVARIDVAAGRAQGVVLDSGEHLAADAVVFNGDVAALADGLLGEAVRRAVPGAGRVQRSLSAITWTGLARLEGLDLERHTVCFNDDYRREFDDIYTGRCLPAQPTVYVCAQDRGTLVGKRPGDQLADVHAGSAAQPGPTAQALPGERLMCLVNAPALPASQRPTPEEINACELRTFKHLRRCGLQLQWQPGTLQRTSPTDFAALFPGSDGALYGQATHGWRASFTRPGASSRLPGLFLAGGSVHPGPGLPMAASSGWRAAEAVLAQWQARRAPRTSIFVSHPAATPGGTPTP